MIRGLLIAAWLTASLAPAAAAEPPADPKVLEAFRADCAAKSAAAERAATMAVAGKDGWLYFDGELRHLAAGRFWGDDAAKAARSAKPEYADPLPAILDFKAQLDRAGVELIVMPVPAKAAVYPDKLSDAAKSGPPRLDAADREFYDLLRRHGVTVIDLTPAFVAAAAKPDGRPLYCKQDTHWSGDGIAVAARQVAEAVKDRPWLKDAKRVAVASESKPVELTGDLYAAVAGPKGPKESVTLRFVGTRQGDAIEPIEPDPASPVLLLGDSHNLVFHQGGDMHAAGAGLPDQLLLELGIPVDVVAALGSGATAARVNLMRNAQADPDYLKHKKLVVWCFGAREFSQSDGWQKVPVVK